MLLTMTRVSMLSMHASPLAPLGTGDGGGMSVYVNATARALSERGDEVDIYTMGNGPEVIDLDSGARVHHVGGGPAKGRAALETTVPQFTNAVAARIAETGGTDIIHAHYWLSGVAGHRLKHELGVPLVSTFHTLGKVKDRTGVVHESAERIDAETNVIRCSDAIVVATSVEASEFRELYGADASALHVVAPGVDHNLFSPGDRSDARRRLDLPRRRPVIMFAGRVQPIKGLDLAIEAVDELRQSVPDVLLIVAGDASGEDGPAALAAARKQVETLDLGGNVRFVGAQSPAMLAEYFRAANACVVPSHSESFGLVALEAAASGLPVVASAVGGLRVIVDHGRTGYLVERGDANGFATALERVIRRPTEAASLSAVAIKRSEKYAWPFVATRLHALYTSLAHRDAESERACLTA